MNIQFLSIIKEAPENFYSPCGTEGVLTLDEIETRATSYLVPNVTLKEMVVRKFAEVIQYYDVNNHFYALKIAYDFLAERGLNEEEVDNITYQLQNEIVMFKSSNGRMIHSPF